MKRELSAFPHPPGFDGYVNPGLTMRQWYAGQALVGILACTRDYAGYNSHEKRVELAFKYADLMMGQGS